MPARTRTAGPPKTTAPAKKAPAKTGARKRSPQNRALAAIVGHEAGKLAPKKAAPSAKLPPSPADAPQELADASQALPLVEQMKLLEETNSRLLQRCEDLERARHLLRKRLSLLERQVFVLQDLVGSCVEGIHDARLRENLFGEGNPAGSVNQASDTAARIGR
jgi:hypothetical protein